MACKRSSVRFRYSPPRRNRQPFEGCLFYLEYARSRNECPSFLKGAGSTREFGRAVCRIRTYRIRREGSNRWRQNVGQQKRAERPFCITTAAGIRAERSKSCPNGQTALPQDELRYCGRSIGRLFILFYYFCRKIDFGSDGRHFGTGGEIRRNVRPALVSTHKFG